MATGSRKILRRFSASISDLLSIQKRSSTCNENDIPLHNAARMGNAVMVHSLLESRIFEIDEEDCQGRTPLHYAMELGSHEVASLLLSLGASPDASDFTGITPTHVAAANGQIDYFDLLLYYKADVSVVDRSGKTPFDHAAENGRVSMLERMLDSGLALSRMDDQHTASALHLASRNGHVQAVSLLLRSGWNINVKTMQGSALHEAAANGRTQVLRHLLHLGIDLSLLNAGGQTAYEVAKKHAARNPLTWKEIRFLLKENKKFFDAEAIDDHGGSNPEELTFRKGDLVWVVQKGRDGDVRYRGIVFGERGNSRSGLLNPAIIRPLDRPYSVLTMSNRLSGMPPNSTTPRQVKKFDIPTVPMSAGPATVSSRAHTRRSEASMRPSTAVMNGNGGRAPSALSRASDERHSVDSANGNRSTAPSFSTFGYGSTSTFKSMPSAPPRGPPNGQAPTQAYQANPQQQPMSSFGKVAPVCSPRNSTGSNSSGFESLKNPSSPATHSSSQSSLTSASTIQMVDSPSSRVSLHSSNGSASAPSSHSSCSVDTLDDSGYGSVEKSFDVTKMVKKGVPEAEILALWLNSLGYSEYLSMFLTQGYDLSSVARITPADLTTLGITIPAHRNKLMQEIHDWRITDSWPCQIPPGGLREWLTLLAMPEYISVFESQGYTNVTSIIKLMWEDFDDIGVKRLGHLKRLQLAIRKLKDGPRAEASQRQSTEAAVPVQSPVHVVRAAVHDPPPPAPASIMKRSPAASNNIDYFSYTRGNSRLSNAGEPMETRREPLKLNLTPTSKILTDSRLLEQTTYSAYGGSDCPPPPAPLQCESSMRRLREAGSSFSSTSSSSSVAPYFANEDCGTIRARNGLSKSVNCIPADHLASRIGLGSTFFNPELNCGQLEDPSLTVEGLRLVDTSLSDEGTSAVLDDLGSMLQNLMADLDAHTSIPKTPPAFPAGAK